MQLQCEPPTAALAPVETPNLVEEILPDWSEMGLAAPATPGSPAPAPSPAPVIPSAAQPAAVPAEASVAPRPRPAPETIHQTLKTLVDQLPGKPTSVGLENGMIAIVMSLDPDTKRLVVPFLEHNCDHQAYIPPQANISGPPLNAHILIVEDAYISRLVLRRVIEQLPGCSVTEAVDGAEAFKLLQNGLNPDLMISDICMPEMDGLQLLTRIRSTPYLAELDVMVCTSTTDRDSVRRAAELGVTKYLVKPFEPKDITQKIVAVLRQSTARSTERIQGLKDRLGLSTAACGELCHELSKQIAEEIRVFRNELGSGKANSAHLTLQRLRGSCALIKDNSLVGRVQAVIQALVANDMFSIVQGLESLEGEGKRLGALGAKLRNQDEGETQKHDPITAAARRAESGIRTSDTVVI